MFAKSAVVSDVHRVNRRLDRSYNPFNDETVNWRPFDAILSVLRKPTVLLIIQGP